MIIQLPQSDRTLHTYHMRAEPTPSGNYQHQTSSRTLFAAAHIVADPLTTSRSTRISIDWETTMQFRHYLANMGLGIAEAMDTAQRGMGLLWPQASELIRRTASELPNALVFNGAGTDQLRPDDTSNIDQVRAAYYQQIEVIEQYGGRIILMASRALARVAQTPDDYIDLYADIINQCSQPVILHWLGMMFDPALKGYWGSEDITEAMATCLQIIQENADKIDGIKVSLLDAQQEIAMRRKLPASVRMYTGDDFNYPQLIAGDDSGHSHALLGIFDPLAPIACAATAQLDAGNTSAFHQLLDPTVPLARTIFAAPTQWYKSGVLFLAWLNGHQQHCIMLDGIQSARSIVHYAQVFTLADQCGALINPELAHRRMQQLLALHGIDNA